MATFPHLSSTGFGLVSHSVQSQSLPAPISLAPLEVEVTKEMNNLPGTKTTVFERQYNIMESEHDPINSPDTETNEERAFRERPSSDSNRQDSADTTLDSRHIDSAVPPPTPQSSDGTLRSLNAYGYEPISPQERAHHRASALTALEAPPPRPTPPPRSVTSAHRF